MTPDDNFDITEVYGPPMVCVDYLSHEWKVEDDIWTSWKAMKTMSKRKEFANGVRLENASWRTWAKQKHNLKTVNPEKLNWLKDSDVTWLYGPLHTAWSNHIVGSPKTSTTEDKLNLMPSSTKSCLKKKSIAEILRPVLGDKNGSILVKSHSDIQLYREFEVDSDCETSSTCSSMSGPSTPTAEPTLMRNERNTNRRIQFNDHVEQYMAVESDEEENNDDGIVLKRDTICKLEPTKLKEDRKHNNEYSALYTNHGRRRATSSNSSKSSTSSSSSNSTSSTSSSSSNTTSSTSSSSSNTTSSTTSTSTSTSSPPSPSYSWMLDDDDELGVEYFDFDATSPPSTYNSGNIIIPPYNITDEDQNIQDEEDDIVDKAVNLVRWVFRARIF